jgi:glutathione S-transferase
MEELVHYTFPQSRGMRTERLLKAFDIPHETVLVDLENGGHRKEEYLEIHPYGRVPALKHGDMVIIESGAILMYLADMFQEKMHTPAPETPERARLYEWLMFLQSTLEQVAVESLAKQDKTSGKENIRELLAAMSSRFIGPYVLGDHFSVLDVILHTDLAWYKGVGLYPEGLEPYDSFMARTHDQMKWD